MSQSTNPRTIKEGELFVIKSNGERQRAFRVTCNYCSSHFLAATCRKGRVKYCSHKCAARGRQEPLRARFNTGYQVLPNGCWYWLRTPLSSRYGKLLYNSKSHSTHRIAMFLFRGFDLQSRLFICHRCDNPSCVNPDHLFIGTNSDNMRDSWGKGRMNSPYVPGEAHLNAKLTTKNVVFIKKMYKKPYTQDQLANKFNVSRRTISFILSGERWKHVTI